MLNKLSCRNKQVPTPQRGSIRASLRLFRNWAERPESVCDRGPAWR